MIQIMESSTGNRAAIYARISRDKKDEGETLDGQIDLCYKLAERHDLTVVEVYREPDGTGASEKSKKTKGREEYDRMLAAARAGEFEHILAYADDRLTRRPIELEELIKLVEATGLKIRTHRFENYDLSTNQGIMAARILGAVAAGEARTISERQQITFERNAYAGKPKLQRQRPFGWKSDGVTLDPDEAERIRGAVREVVSGASITSIGRRWEEEGVLTAAGGSQWEHSVLKRVLVGWRTAGVRTYRREPIFDKEGNPVMGTWTAIISLEERRQALRALEAHARVKKRQGSWPLAGLLRCGICAKPLYGQTPSGTRPRAIYACKKGHVGISAGLLEQHIIKVFFMTLYKRESEGYFSKKTEQATEPNPDDLLRIEEITAQISELMEGYRTKTLPAAIAFAEVDRLYAERDSLQRQVDADSTRPSAPVIGFQESTPLEEQISFYQDSYRRPPAGPDGYEQSLLWGQGSIDQLNHMLKLQIDTVVVYKAQPGMRKIPDRVQFIWVD